MGVVKNPPTVGTIDWGMKESRARHLRSEEDAPKRKMTFPIYTHQTTYVVASYAFPIKGNPSEDIKELLLEYN